MYIKLISLVLIPLGLYQIFWADSIGKKDKALYTSIPLIGKFYNRDDSMYRSRSKFAGVFMIIIAVVLLLS